MSSSPSEPSFFRATPNTRAKRTSPKMFIPSISVPMGTCGMRGDGGPKFTPDELDHHFKGLLLEGDPVNITLYVNCALVINTKKYI